MRPAGTTSFLRGATSVSYMDPQKLGFSSKWTRKAIDESHCQLSVDAKLMCLSREWLFFLAYQMACYQPNTSCGFGLVVWVFLITLYFEARQKKKNARIYGTGLFGLPPTSCLGICGGNRSESSGFICLGSCLESWVILSPDNCQEKSSPCVFLNIWVENCRFSRRKHSDVM